MHSRKVRMENAEKQQALALERMQKMVEENELAAQQMLKEKYNNDKENDISNIETCESKNDNFYSELNNTFNKKSLEETVIDNNEIDESIEKTVNNEINHEIDSPHDLVNSINNSILIAAPAPYMKDQEKEGMMDIAKANGTATSIIGKDMHLTDKDSVMGDSEMILSDVESEGTQPEEVIFRLFMYFKKLSIFTYTTFNLLRYGENMYVFTIVNLGNMSLYNSKILFEICFKNISNNHQLYVII